MFRVWPFQSARMCLGKACSVLFLEGLQGEDCGRIALGGRAGLAGRQGFISQALGVEFHPGECSLYRLDHFSYWS